MRRVAFGLLWLYKRAVSPYLPSRCRFHPTCSEYAAEAIDRHGMFRGGWLTLKRLVRCTPFFQGGYDPVP
jgi:putative membrane protein insertion efficiency factor